MEQVFKEHQLCKLHGPLGPYFDSYATEMCREGYAQQTREVEIRVVADFDRWLARHRLGAQEVTAELFGPFLRARARRRHLTRCDVSALKRLMRLLVRERIVPEPARPAATPVERLQAEFGFYLQEERALSSRTQFCYLIFVREFLKERFGNRSADLSSLCAADITGFVRRRAATIQSKRVQMMTTALRSFLRFARYRGDIDKDLAACVAAIANWKLSTIPRAIPTDQVELLLSSIDRKTAVGRRDYAILLILARLGLRAGEIKALTLGETWIGKRDWLGCAGRRAAIPNCPCRPMSARPSLTTYETRGPQLRADVCFFGRERQQESLGANAQ